MIQMIGTFAEFARAIIRERTMAGLVTARSQGRIGGRKHKLTNAQRAAIAETLYPAEKPARTRNSTIRNKDRRRFIAFSSPVTISRSGS